MSQTVKSKWPKIYFAIVFIYFFLMRFLVIPSGDDFFWGGDQGKYLLQHGFYGPQAIYGGSSNGRYIGNFLEIFTIHHLLPAMLMYGVFWTLLIWCMWRLTGKTKLSLVLSSLFVFTFQDGYLSTVLAWNAGFINYVPPLSLILLYLVINQQYFEHDVKHSLTLGIGTFLISFVGGFFVEHLTLYQIFIGVLAIVVGRWFFKKKINFFQGSYLLGAVLSAAILFSHPAYHEHSTYRNTDLNVQALIGNYFNVTHFWFNTLNVIVNLVICIAIVMLSSKLIKNSFRRVMTELVAGGFAVYYLVINLWLTTKQYDEFFMFKKLFDSQVAHIDGIVTIIFWLFLIYATISFFNLKQDYLAYFSMFSYFALISPFLLIVSPINSREFFTAYIFLYIGAMFFLKKALSLYSFNFRRQVKVVTSAALLICALAVGTKMTMNYQVNLQRVSETSFLDGKTALQRHVPFRKYVLSNDALLQQSAVYWKDYLHKTWLERM